MSRLRHPWRIQGFHTAERQMEIDEDSDAMFVQQLIVGNNFGRISTETL